jgi:hypothetical protein
MSLIIMKYAQKNQKNFQSRTHNYISTHKISSGSQTENEATKVIFKLYIMYPCSLIKKSDFH